MDGKTWEWERVLRANDRAVATAVDAVTGDWVQGLMSAASSLTKPAEPGSSVQSLESRQLMSITLDDGELTAQGTKGDDQIVLGISRDNANYAIYFNGRRSAYPRSEVHTVNLRGGRGSDTLRVSQRKSNLMRAKVVADGGRGKDLMLGALTRRVEMDNPVTDDQTPQDPEPPTTDELPDVPSEPDSQPDSEPETDLETEPETDPLPQDESGEGGGGGGDTDQAPIDYADRIISVHTGHFENDPTYRRVHDIIRYDGWSAYVERIIQPDIDWGVRRILLHNPFGSLPNSVYDFDQYVMAKEEGLTNLVEGFVEAWKPITDSGIEVIGYLGQLPYDSDFTDPDDPTYYNFERFWESVQPLIDAGMSVGLDAMVMADDNGGPWECVQMLQAMGVKVYVEGRPMKDYDHWFDVDTIMLADWYERSNPELYDDSANWAARDEQLTGEVMIWQHMPTPGNTWYTPNWLVEAGRNILSRGQTVLLSVQVLQWEGATIESFTAGLPGAA